MRDAPQNTRSDSFTIYYKKNTYTVSNLRIQLNHHEINSENNEK